MEINVESFNDVSVLHCDGSLDAGTVTQFKEVAKKLMEKGETKFVINCEDVSYVDSIGLGTLISLLRSVREKQGDVKISGLTDHVKTVFEITRLHRLFDVSGDWKTAANRF